MKKYNLYLDDFRHPLESFHYMKDISYNLLEWQVVRSYEDFVSRIEEGYKNGEFPGLISFDHDLADDHYSHLHGTIPYDKLKEKTGYHCAKWLIDFCIDNDMILPEFKVHSMNPTGKVNIKSLLENFKKYQDNE